MFDYVSRQKNYKADRRSAAKLSLNQSRGAPILQLVQQGKLSLSAPLSRWLPYVQDAGRITVKMLLGMTSGIYSEPPAR